MAEVTQSGIPRTALETLGVIWLSTKDALLY
jgi:hypothetical protein